MTPLRVLIIEDVPDDANLMVVELRRAGFDPTVTCVATEADYGSALEAELDVILADHSLPQFDAHRALELLRTRALDIPFIVVSGTIDEDVAVDFMRRGASDYLLKDRLARLGESVRQALAATHARTERRQHEQALRISEERYALAARGANDGLWDWDLVSDDLYLSERWHAMLGSDGSQPGTSPQRWLGRIHADDLTRFRASLDAHLRGEVEHLEIEIRVRHEDGGERWLLVRGIALRDRAGAAVRIAGSMADVTTRKQLEARLVRLVEYDELTGLLNRAFFMDRLTHAIARAPRQGFTVAMLFLDVDDLKVVNDSLGHDVGDELLRQIAARLGRTIRAGDTAARLGGDEFAVLLENIHAEAEACLAAERIVASMQAPIVIGEHEIRPTFSVGVSLSSLGRDSSETLMRHADLAMDHAKANGKAQYAVFDQDMATAAMDRLTLEAELRDALDRAEFRIDYQPIVDLETGRIIEMEALIRWDHPRHGMISPARIIPIAEETGLIVPLGRWVLEEACRQAQAWRVGVPHRGDLIMSVNLSARQFRHPDLLADVTRILRETGLDASALKLEITESMVMEGIDEAIATARALTNMGVRLAMDDLGTGYSSFAYLKALPLDTLKVDRSFVHALGFDRDDTAIVRSVLALAGSLGLTVTAEGIETDEQCEVLRSLGCDRGQGYYLARPAPAEDIWPLLEANVPLMHPPHSKIRDIEWGPRAPRLPESGGGAGPVEPGTLPLSMPTVADDATGLPAEIEATKRHRPAPATLASSH